MSSSVRLISEDQIPEASAQDEFIWVYQTNDNWIPFSDAISSSIETAFRNGFEEIFIDEVYRIDLKHFVQEYLADRDRKQTIRRRQRSLKALVSSDAPREDESRRGERFSFPLGLVSGCSASVDTSYYGSPFIAKWFLMFTNGKRNVTFASIFPFLVQGLREEGQSEPEDVIDDIVNSINKVKDEVLRKSEKKKMEELEDCCAKLYTQPYFIYRRVNIALRDNDHTKQRTLGPYCFLVFNYIGRHFDDNFSIHRRLHQTFRPTRSVSSTVFRGDYISGQMLEEYQQAAGDKSIYFKWLPFVSTSRDRDISENFAQNVLYIIQLQRHSIKDQFTDISSISVFKEEKEIILQPGVRFQVVKVEFNDIKNLHLVHINIVPSYVSGLR